MSATSKVSKLRTWPLALAHGLNDGYGAFLGALLPVLIDKFKLSLALAGLLSSLRTGVASFGQLPLGWWADRGAARPLALAGPLLTCAAMSTVGILPRYGAVAVALLFAGLGTAAFHPAAAALVSPQSARRGARMALFSSGGALGAGVGPLVVAAVVASLGLMFTPLLLIPAVAMWLVLLRFWPAAEPPVQAKQGSLLGHPQSGQLLRLWALAVLRDFVSASYTTFLAVLWRQREQPLTIASLALSVFAFSEGMGNLIGGRLSDRLGRKRVIVGSLALALPLFYLFLLTDGFLSFLFLGLAGAVLISSVPVCVVLGQELVPEQRGLVSGLMMGLAWGVGSLLMTCVGYLGDRLGLEVALGILTGLLMPALLLALGLKESSSGS